MLVARRELLHGALTFCALCANAAEPTHGRRGLWRRFATFVHEPGKFLELRQRFRGHAGFFSLSATQGDDAGQVAIARAFTVTVDGSLNVGRAGFQSRQSVGDAESDVVVRVNADLAIQFAACGLGDGGDFDKAGNRHSCRTTPRNPRFFGSAPVSSAYSALSLLAVERMFAVVDDELAVIFQIFHGVGDHRGFSSGVQRSTSFTCSSEVLP